MLHARQEPLIEIAQALTGRDDRQLAILAEGNTSAKISAETFLVKASGSNLGTLDENLYAELKNAGASIYIIKFEIAGAAAYAAMNAPGTSSQAVAS